VRGVPYRATDCRRTSCVQVVEVVCGVAAEDPDEFPTARLARVAVTTDQGAKLRAGKDVR